MKSDKLLIAVNFILISLIWGSTWLVIKIGLDSIPPLFGVALRFTIAVAILFVIIKIRKEKIVMSSRAVMVYIVLALFSFSIPFALVYWGEQYIASGLASILFASYPFVIALGSHLFITSEKMSLYKLIGIGLGFIGVATIFWGDFRFGSQSSIGMGAILLSVLMQGSSLIIVKKYGEDLSPTSMNFVGMLISIFIMYTLAFIFEDTSQVNFDTKGWGSLIYLGTLGTVVTFISYFWLLKKMEIVYLSLVSFITPVIAVVLGALLLNETLSPFVFFGSALVLAGILSANGDTLIKPTTTNNNN